MRNFWKELKNNGPIIALAPLANVTDVAFRHIISKNSNIPHVTYTEFVSADGLCLAPELGRNKLLKDLEYSEIERPIVAQFFTSRPEHMESVAKLALELGFDGVDINMGCPDKSVEKQGAGAALIKNPKLARELIRSAKRGATLRQAQGNRNLSVSVKTRIGYNKDESEEFIPQILKEKPDALIVHLRTRKEMSKVPAHWERMPRIVEIRDEISPETLILGNGDIKTIEEGLEKCKQYGCDGVMLGRAVFGNPFLFSSLFSTNIPTEEEKIEVLKEHIKLFDEKLGETKSFSIMKKHFKSYISNKILRDKIMQTETAEQAISMLE